MDTSRLSLKILVGNWLLYDVPDVVDATMGIERVTDLFLT